MDRVLTNIFERFDPEHLAHRLTSDSIWSVQQRAPPIGFGAFSEAEADSHADGSVVLYSSETALAISSKQDAYLSRQSTRRHLKTPSRAQIAVREKLHDAASQFSAKQHESQRPTETATVQAAPFIDMTHEKTQNDCTDSAKTDTKINAPPKHKRVYVKSERRRLQCLASQKRYIKKQAEKLKNLEIAVAQLENDVPLLEMRRDHLLNRTPRVCK
ncbi:hypothetical protein PHYBOEH_003720, partial [Phytophthora boehmeriae]